MKMEHRVLYPYEQKHLLPQICTMLGCILGTFNKMGLLCSRNPLEFTTPSRDPNTKRLRTAKNTKARWGDV